MLENSTLHLVLEDWSYWKKAPPSSTYRQVLKKLPPLASDLILAIQGVRRSGKSTLMTQIMQHYKLPPTHCFFINFEDPRLSAFLNTQLLEQVVELAKKLKPKARAYYFFFDEIQNVKEWEKWLHVKSSRPSNEFFTITGSNAALLSGDLGTALTGRHRKIELFPFSWPEYQDIKKNFFKRKTKPTMSSYLAEGGFPRVLTYPEPLALLQEYFRDIISRDVRRHLNLRSELGLIQLVKAVFESTGSELSQRKLAAQLSISNDTAKSYLEACEEAYLILSSSYFSFSERQRAVRNKKYYPIDLGLRRAIINPSFQDKGKSLETIVFYHLRKKFDQVYYWKGKGEVDFVVEDASGITPYQVTHDPAKERHWKALKEFREAFPQSKEPVLITYNNLEKFLDA